MRHKDVLHMSNNPKEGKYGFENCVLKREFYANTIIDIINNDKTLTGTNSFVIALDSPWGTGKTTFIKMLKNKIGQKHGNIHTVIYNAWENDYCENPFDPLFYDIISNDIFKNEINKKNISNLAKCVRNLPKSLVKDRISRFGENTANTVNEAGNNFKALLLKKLPPIKELEKERQAIANFKACLSNTVESLNDQKLLIMVDELDRCKPLFAIKTLEIIKHLFDIPDIIFLLSVDFSQLRHSISTVYGQNMDSEGYLRRFVNHVIKLPEPAKDDYVSFLIKQSPPNINESNKGVFEDELKKILNWNILSLRDINAIYENFKMFYNSRFTDASEYYALSLPYLVLMSLKYKKTEFYDAVIGGDRVRIEQMRQNFDPANVFGDFLAENAQNDILITKKPMKELLKLVDDITLENIKMQFSPKGCKYTHKDDELTKAYLDKFVNYFNNKHNDLKKMNGQHIKYPLNILPEDILRCFEIDMADLRPVQYVARQIEMFTHKTTYTSSANDFRTFVFYDWDKSK